MVNFVGKALIYGGILLLGLGLIVYFSSENLLSWLGNLPGDIRLERENFRFFFPITTMIIISLIINIIIRVVNFFF